jgi:hypothetical protein
MGPKGEPDTKTDWSTERRPQDELQPQRIWYANEVMGEEIGL